MRRTQQVRRALKGAERRHFDRAQLAQHNQFMVGHSIGQGRESTRVAFVANGGALVAGLTVLSQADGGERGWLFAAYVCFAAGITAAIAGYAITRSLIREQVLIGVDYAEARRLHRKYSGWELAALISAIAAFALGLGCFAAHIFEAGQAPSKPSSNNYAIIQLQMSETAEARPGEPERASIAEPDGSTLDRGNRQVQP